MDIDKIEKLYKCGDEEDKKVKEQYKQHCDKDKCVIRRKRRR